MASSRRPPMRGTMAAHPPRNMGRSWPARCRTENKRAEQRLGGQVVVGAVGGIRCEGRINPVWAWALAQWGQTSLQQGLLLAVDLARDPGRSFSFVLHASAPRVVSGETSPVRRRCVRFDTVFEVHDVACNRQRWFDTSGKQPRETAGLIACGHPWLTACKVLAAWIAG